MKSWMERIRHNRQQLQKDLHDVEKRKYLSPETLSEYGLARQAVARFARGTLIDLGCGDAPYRRLASARVDRYDTLDLGSAHHPATFSGDIQNMDMIPLESYDSALCLEVLEHVPDPQRALQEVQRILRIHGTCIVSVPHLSRLHDIPHDYFRFTEFGLRVILERAGLEVLEMHPRGGLFSFIGHQVSTALVCLAWPIPLVKWVVFELNKFLVTYPCFYLDRWLDRDHRFASGYLCVARKNSA